MFVKDDKNFDKYSDTSNGRNIVSVLSDEERKRCAFSLHKSTKAFLVDVFERRKVSNPSEIKGLGINVVTLADIDVFTGHLWADFWVKRSVQECIEAMGHTTEVTPELADVTLYLWGHPIPEAKNHVHLYNHKTKNICWAYSHPDKMTEPELKKYHKVFFASEKAMNHFIRKVPKIVDPTVIYSCTPFIEPQLDIKSFNHEITFVGNARGNLYYGRDIINKLDNKFLASVWGARWNKIEKKYFNPIWYQSRFIPYSILPELYKTSKICLNDHHEDHNKWEYVSFRIFDILASGGFCISDYNSGIKKIFGDAVPTFKTADELNRLVEYFLENPDRRLPYIAKGRAIASKYTTLETVKQIFDLSGIPYEEPDKEYESAFRKSVESQDIVAITGEDFR